MTTNNTLRLLLLVLCLATILTSVSSCSKHNDLATQKSVATGQDSYFSRIQFYTDGRKPATDTVWTLHLTSQQLVNTYQSQNGYIYTQTSTFVERGVLWTK